MHLALDRFHLRSALQAHIAGTVQRNYSLAVSVTEDGLAYEDGRLELLDGRTVAWRWWGEAGGTPVLRLQGTPGSRLFRHPDPAIQRGLGVRFLMADRPGYGGSTRLPGRGIAVIADDLAALLDHHHLDRVPVMGGSGGGPHALAIAARHPERVTAVSVIVGASRLEPDEVGRLVGVNAAGYAAAEVGWEPVHRLGVELRERLLGDEGIAGVLSDAPPHDRALMQDPAWLRMVRAGNAEALRQGADGWTDEVMALHRDWDFELESVQATVTWWHGDDDMNAPLSAAQRTAARLRRVDLRVWHGQGHLAALEHEREILEELLGRSAEVVRLPS
jgi:pimeloyl-ACP methyl ester carboxylesterase